MTNAAGILRELADEYWEARLAEDPIFATVLGDHRFDDKLPDLTPEGRRKAADNYESILRRCEAIGREELQAADRMTRSALMTECRAQLAYSSCHLEEWAVDPLGGPQVELLNLESLQPTRSVADGLSMARRWAAMGQYLNEYIANLDRGLKRGKVAVRTEVEKVIEETQDLLAKPNSQWSLLRPLSTPHVDWTVGDREKFSNALTASVRDSTRPAFERYLEFLKRDVLPRSRPDGRPGIAHLPEGADAYAKLIRVHTSMSLTPDELHETGLSEVARINREMVGLGEKVFGLTERPDILNRLRTDSSLYFFSRDEVFEKAEAALSKARSAIKNWFGRLPKAECEVVRMEEHEEKHSTIAYYRQPAADGSRPGRYYINTSAPETRPRYEAEALAYHESIPGHHLQIAIAQELEGMPDFRRHSGTTAFVEGWGLYTERLSDEMGLYTSDLDRIGVLSYDSWRACRLVVDTGMHAKGWSRSRAIEFMLQNSALAKNNIVNEVDRYITWPGQALAYKTGQLEILRLRKEAEKRLGNRFDIRLFHDAVLENGAVPLESLRQTVEERLT